MQTRSYRDLIVYQKSYKMAKASYELTKNFPEEERYGLTSQVKRALTSIPLNIAEGYGKAVGGKELKRFLLMARGSCAEMEVLLELSKDFGYIEENIYKLGIERYEEIGKMLTGLIKSIENKQ